MKWANVYSSEFRFRPFRFRRARHSQSAFQKCFFFLMISEGLISLNRKEIQGKLSCENSTRFRLWHLDYFRHSPATWLRMLHLGTTSANESRSKVQERGPCACVRVFTHLETLVLSLYPHNILLQYALKSLVEWQLSEMRRIKKCS
jgi:hypothetical protein